MGKSRAPKVISVQNVNQAFYEGLQYILDRGDRAETRNGPTIKARGTLITHYSLPSQRMLLVPRREANPFFHIFESIWMLAGKQDVEFPAHYVPSMKNFSDDGEKFNAAYGFRWRKHFTQDDGEAIDQIEAIVRILHKDPGSRRVVLQMWDPYSDLLGGEKSLKDTACNLLVKYGIADGELNASVCCRSNDMVLGGYGANAVHFSFLQEYLVDRLRELGMDVRMGFYEQISMDAHIYTELYADKLWNGVEAELKDFRDSRDASADKYFQAYHHSGYGFEDNDEGGVVEQPDVLFTVSPILFRATMPLSHVEQEAYPICPVTTSAEFDRECKVICTFKENPDTFGIKSPYLKHVILPMMAAYKDYKVGDLETALYKMKGMRENLTNIFHLKSHFRFDVEVACTEWLQRRLDARNLKLQQSQDTAP